MIRSNIFRTFSALFVFLLVVYILGLGLVSFSFGTNYFVNLTKEFGIYVLIGMLLLFFCEFLISFVSFLFDKDDIFKRRSIVLFFVALFLVLNIIFFSSAKISTFEDVFLVFSMPTFIFSLLGILSFVDFGRFFYFYPSFIFIFGAVFLIFMSAVLLHLPMSSSTGEPIPLVDAFFISTSAVSCTGLSTISVGKNLSFFGQIVLLLSIELGGLLIILISTAGILYGIVSRDAIVKLRMASLFEIKNLSGMKNLILKFLSITLVSQIIVAFLLYPYFIDKENDVGRAVFYSIFHVISALNNAGFSLYDDSFIGFDNKPFFLMLIAFLILLGNTGLPVITEVFDNLVFVIKRKISSVFNLRFKGTDKKVSLSLHSKIVLISHSLLIIIGTFLLLLFEKDNLLSGVKFPLVNAIFDSISFRTAGFSSLDYSEAKDITYFFFSIIMFIGGGSISIAGGVKVNTVALFFIASFSFLRSYSEISLFRKRVDFVYILKSSLIVVSSGLLVFLGTIIFYRFSNELNFIKNLFEVCSAFGTVGMSSGITNGDLSVYSKSILILVMFLGKIGLLTVLSIFASKPRKIMSYYPEEKIVVG